jgi:SAM-dependent methyltransferase
VRDYITGESFDLLRCGNCGLVVTHPAPADLARYYSARYRTHRQKLTAEWRTRRRADQIERLFAPGFKGRVLDLGCGTGSFALEMRRRGWSVAVTELNDAVLERMREHGMEAKQPADAMREGFAGAFDAITCWHVLEHVPRPLEMASWARTILSPAGVFQATVPNLDSWQARQFGRQWMHLDVPRHLYHFTPATLRDLLGRAGLRIESQDTVAVEYDLFGVVQSALNGVCSRPNVLYEQITGGDDVPPARPRDVIASFGLLPLLGPLATAHTVIAGAVGKGGSLSVVCRADALTPSPSGRGTG